MLASEGGLYPEEADQVVRLLFKATKNILG